MTTTVTISKTIQIRQYEPLTVTITRTLEDKDDTAENRQKLYRVVGAQVKKTLDGEVERYSANQEE